MKDLKLCQIPFSTSVTERCVVTQKLKNLEQPNDVKKHITCFHTTAIKISNEKILSNKTAKIHEEYYSLQVKDERYKEMKTSSWVKVQTPKVRYNSGNVPTMQMQESEMDSPLTEYIGKNSSNPKAPTEEIFPQELPRPPEPDFTQPNPTKTKPIQQELPRFSDFSLTLHSQLNPPMKGRPLLQELPRPPDSLIHYFVE